MTQLIISVKQGEVLDFPLTIKEDGIAKNLTGYTIRVQVKQIPYKSADTIFEKIITSTSDTTTQGQITNPSGGELFIRLLEEDTSLTAKDYALVIFLEDDTQKDIISSALCNGAIYRVCTQ